jgi:hypothetical protein
MNRGPRRAPDHVPERPAAAEAKIREDDAPAWLQNHVRRLDVAMHQTRRLHRFERPTKGQADAGDFSWWQRVAALDFGLQSVATQQFHPHPDTATVRADAVNRHDARMAHTCQGPRLIEQRCFGWGRSRRRVGLQQELEGHVAL